MIDIPYKTYVNGAALTPEDLNTYLQPQTVMTFDSSSQRSAALTTPTEGMVTYLKDTDSLEVYNGSAWVPNTSYVQWASWTTALSGTGWALGNGTVTGTYTQIGKTVIGEARITFGTTSTAGTGTNVLACSLPVSRRAGPLHIANAFYTVGSNQYQLFTTVSGTQVNFYTLGTNGLRGNFNSTTPTTFVAANTTNVQFNFVYEAN